MATVCRAGGASYRTSITVPTSVNSLRSVLLAWIIRVLAATVACRSLPRIRLRFREGFSEGDGRYSVIRKSPHCQFGHYCDSQIMGNEALDRLHGPCLISVSYTHLRAHETDSYLVCRLL